MVLKYKIGDKVRIKSIDWYNANKDEYGVVLVENGDYMFCKSDIEWCGKIVTIAEVCLNEYYRIVEDFNKYRWTDEMIEGLVEEESIIDLTVKGEEFKERIEIAIPEGYEYVIESGKIIFIKKKKEYPKTFLECCDVLNIGNLIERGVKGYKAELFDTLQKLYICRDAYWQIAGEEMGLGKPWEPDYTNTGEKKFSIWVDFGEIKLGGPFTTTQMVLSFPAEEMRDAFYENFKEEIEMCKELL